MKKLKILIICGVLFFIASCQSKPESITINLPDEIKVGEKCELIATIQPEDGGEKITWECEDDKVIIDDKYLYGAKVGQTIITAKTESGVFEKKTITITEPEIANTSLRLAVGQIISFDDQIIDSSEYFEYGNNQITALKEGETTVKALKKFENDIEFQYDLTIEIFELTIVYNEVLALGDSFMLGANAEVVYSVVGDAVEILEDFTVVAVKEGTSYVTAEIPGTNVKKEILIKVVAPDNELFDIAKELITPVDDIDKYPFVNEVEVTGNLFTIEWIFPEGMVIDGKLNRQSTNETYEVKAKLTNQGVTQEYSYQFEMISGDDFLAMYAEQLSVPSEIDDDIELITEYNGIDVEWTSSKKHILSEDGKLKYVDEPVEIELSVTLVYNDEYFYDLSFTVLAKPLKEEKRIALALEKFTLPEIATTNLNLKTSFDYGVKGYWLSSDEEAINHLGHVNITDKTQTVKLTLRAYVTDDQVYQEKEFIVDTKAIILNEGEEYFGGHNYLSYAKDTVPANQENIKLNGDRFELTENAVSGYYESNVVVITASSEVVASWAAITTVTANIEVMVRVRIGGTWSKYFTYGTWGLGAPNLYYNQTDSKAKMSVDEIIATSGSIDAFQYYVKLTRDKVTTESPKVLLISVALNINNYYYGVDTSGLPSQVDYDVPKLNQNEVPTIGSVICSATTTTMLLKYKGMSFADKDAEFEHRYIADLVKDMGHQSPTYGNWVFNMAVAGAYGYDARVTRMYSWEELKYYLATKGPVGASIGGDFGLYTTGGHLIVVRGYREENGKTIVITNDPNVNTRFGEQYYVYYEVTLEMFMDVWGGVVYIVE